MNRISPFLLFLSCFLIPALKESYGQQNDFQGWPSAQVNLEVLKDLKFHLEEEIRFRENISRIDRQINDIGASYRFNKYFKAAFYYRIAGNWKNSGEVQWSNGIYADLSGRIEPGRFTLGYQLRLQSSRVALRNNEEQWFDGLTNRHKISVEYDIKGLPIHPFTEGLLYTHFGGSEGSAVLGYRIWVGTTWSISRMHEITLKYGVDQELNVTDPERAYIIALGYTLNLKLSSVK